MFVAAYCVGALLTSAYAAYMLTNHDVGWMDVVHVSLSTGSAWPIALPMLYSVRHVFSDP